MIGNANYDYARKRGITRIVSDKLGSQLKQMTSALSDIRTTASWETPGQNHLAKPFLNY
jgi:hypothetical protein